jgi:hypothetical protein
MGGCREYRPLVIAEHLKPGRNVAGMILAVFQRDPEISAKKRRTKLSHKLFAGLSRISKGLAAQIAIKP